MGSNPTGPSKNLGERGSNIRKRETVKACISQRASAYTSRAGWPHDWGSRQLFDDGYFDADRRPVAFLQYVEPRIVAQEF